MCTALVGGRGHLLDIDANPKGAGFGTKMLNYMEKKALENGLITVTVSAIADDEDLRHFSSRTDIN